MKSRHVRLPVGLGLLLLFGASPALAHQPTPNFPSKWMIEIAPANKPREYLRMPEGRSERYSDVYDINLDSNQHKGPNELSNLEFRYWMQGTGVRVHVSLTFNPSAGRPNSKRELPVGDFLIRPGETITVSRLSRFGVQPVELKIVTAEPPHAVKPEIINETSSLMVEDVAQDRAEYKLSLRNTSVLTALSVVISVFASNGRCKMHDFQTWFGPLIPPGQTAEFALSFPIAPEDSGVVSADGTSCSSTPRIARGLIRNTRPSRAVAAKIVIEAVDFEDGGYQGNSQSAAMLEAQRLGRKTGRTRVSALVENEIVSAQPDGMAKLGAVRSQVESLRDIVDPTVINSILTRFSTLPKGDRESIERDFQNGVLMEKGMVLRNLRLYLFELNKGMTTHASLRQWWKKTEGSCDFLSQRSCPGF